MIKYVLPNDFIEEMRNLLKEDFTSFIKCYENEREYAFRVNTLKVRDKESFLNDLQKELQTKSLFEQVPWCLDAFYYKEEDSLGKCMYQEAGCYYIQEPSAMMVVSSQQIEEGESILDLCAAPGGKTTHIAAKLNGTGLIVSNDITLNRAKILSKNVERCGIRNALVLSDSLEKIVGVSHRCFDKVFVDAPCSGEGMFRKNPEALVQWSRGNVLICAKRQKEILRLAKDAVKGNGFLIYSTCTFSKEENEEVINDFLLNNSDFKLIDQYKCMPHKIRGEGHFIAIMQRDNSSINSFKERKSNVSKGEKQLFDKWAKQTLSIDIEPNLAFGETLYLTPTKIPDLKGIKILRCGLKLGSIENKIFKPDHALAMALEKGNVKNFIDIKDTSIAIKYLRGETLECSFSGWGLVLYKGYSLGWCKGDGSMAKNHYPKGLRK